MPQPRRRPRVAGLSPTGTAATSHRAGKPAEQAEANGGQRLDEGSRRQQAIRRSRRGATERAEEPVDTALPEEITTASAIARGEDEHTQQLPVVRDEPEAADDDAASEESHLADIGHDIAGPREKKWLLPTCLIVIAVLLGAFAAFAGVQWRQAAGANSNSALTDADTTNQVTTQVSNALNTLLAFDYKHPNKNDQASKNLIDGKLGDCGSSDKVGYGKLMGVLKQQGPKQQLSLRSTVLKAGVQQLQGDRAQLLVLLDQEYSKGSGSGAKQSSAVVAATVQAVNKDGGWKLRSLCLQ